MDLINSNKIIAVVRFDETDVSTDYVSSCIEGGIKLIEVIVTMPGSYELIETLSANSDICVGAGTVLNIKSAEMAQQSGAKFIVSPHTDEEIIKFAKSNGIVSIAGAFTSSEIVNATAMGADFVKIFPASSVGPNYIKAIKEALPFVNILVTGGINISNVRDYIISGASLVGISTALTGNSKVLDKNVVRSNARQFAETLDSIQDS